MSKGVPDLATIRTGGKAPLATALSVIERTPHAPGVLALLKEAFEAAQAHVVGLTGPPGVGKSTLMNALIEAWRADGRTVGVIAVDPSSPRTGGALLGDRTRLVGATGDSGLFVRSMAARDRLGGLASLTYPAMILMRAVFDIVLLETVGVGQSETDVVNVADTIVFCIQPGSGDSLQFMKAGITEIPDIAVVTKADLGAVAERARADMRGALHFRTGNAGGWQIPVLAVSATQGSGIDELVDAVDSHRTWLAQEDGLTDQRARQARHWLRDTIRERFGRDGLRRAQRHFDLDEPGAPFAIEARVAETLAHDQ